MSDILQVGLSEEQRELLLRGLRFVRSSVMLDIREPSPDVAADRQTQLAEISALVDQLNGSRPANAPAGV